MAAIISHFQEEPLNVFNRASDTDGKAYWVNEITTGTLTRGTLMKAMVDAAGTNGSNDGLMLANQASFGVWAAVNQVPFATANAQLSSITSVESTLTAAQTAVSGTTGGATGSTFTLTKSGVTGSFDTVNGTSGNDTIIAGPTALETGDVISGGVGTDSLYTQDAADLTAARISSVEKIYVRNDMSASDTFSMSDVTGATEVWADRLTNLNATLTISGAGLTTAVAVGITEGGSTSAADLNDVTFTFSGVTGSADTATLKLDKANADVVTIANIETLNVVTSSDSSKIDGSLTAANASKVVFTGDKNVTIDATDLDNANGYTIDASAFTGNLVITLEDQAAGKSTTVTGGSGNDKFYLTTGLDSKDSVNGGTGTNTIGLTTAADLTAITGAKLTNIQVFDVAGAAAGTYDMSFITGAGTTSTITSIAVSADVAGAVIIDKLVDTGTVAINATTTAALTIQQAGAADAGSNADTLSVAISSTTANVTVASLVAADIETVTINSAATTAITTGHTITATTFANAATVKFTGDEQLTVTTLGAVAATSVDATAMTDKFIMTNASDAATILLLQGGSAADTLLIDEGTQLANSVVQGNGGADTITESNSDQTTIYKYVLQTDSTTTAWDKITGFVTATDDINIAAFGFTGAAAGAILDKSATVTSTTTGASADFAITAANAANFFNDSGVDRGVAIDDNGSDIFVFIDANKNGDWDTADMAILLVGNTTTLTTGDFVFA